MDNLLFTLVEKWRKELVPEHGPFVRGILSEGFTALSDTITCHTVSSVDGSSALIIFTYSISSLELTLNGVFFFAVFLGLCESVILLKKKNIDSVTTRLLLRAVRLGKRTEVLFTFSCVSFMTLRVEGKA